MAKKVKEIKKVKKSEKPTIEGAETKKEKKSGAAKVKKEVVAAVIQVKHSKVKELADYCPATGSRFTPGTSKQVALDIVVNAIKAGKNCTEIRKELAEYRKENGKDRDLDAGYFPYVVAMHPEHFEIWTTGEAKLIKEFKADPSAMADWEKKREEKSKIEKKETKSKKTNFRKEKPVVSDEAAESKPKAEKRKKPVLTK